MRARLKLPACPGCPLELCVCPATPETLRSLSHGHAYDFCRVRWRTFQTWRKLKGRFDQLKAGPSPHEANTFDQNYATVLMMAMLRCLSR